MLSVGRLGRINGIANYVVDTATPSATFNLSLKHRLKRSSRKALNEWNIVDKTTKRKWVAGVGRAESIQQRKVNDLKNPLDELKIASADETRRMISLVYAKSESMES